MADHVEAWDALAASASEPNPFFESWYLLPSIRALDGKDKVFILRFELDGQLCGLLPAIRSFGYYRWPIPNVASWCHANCFLGTPLVLRGAEVAFWRALLSWADAHSGPALMFHLQAIPIGGPVELALQTAVARTRRRVALVHREARALLCSDLAADAYLASALSGKKRKELRRQMNRLQAEGAVEVERRTDNLDLAIWIEQFLRLEASGWKGRAGSALGSDAATAQLFRESLTGAADRGKLERLTLTLDGKCIAMLATFLTPPGAFSYKTAYDESYARFSPGVLLQRENLALLERHDIDWCDSCAAADHPMIDHIWRERRVIGRHSIAIGGIVRQAAFGLLSRAEAARGRASSRR